MPKTVKQFIIILFSITFFSFYCCSNITQYDMNRSATNNLKRLQGELDECCKQILTTHKDDKAFVEKFNASQKAWEQYCKDYLEALYPKEDKQTAYGSFFPVNYAADKKRLIKRRIEDLSPWLYRIEGDCGISYLTYDELIKRGLIKNLDDKYVRMFTNPKIDWKKTTPLVFLDALKHVNRKWVFVDRAPEDWITENDVDELIKLVDSEEPAPPVVSVLSSYAPVGETSTVGNEAMFMINGFIKKKYPPRMCSVHYFKGNPKKYKAWYNNYKK